MTTRHVQQTFESTTYYLSIILDVYNLLLHDQCTEFVINYLHVYKCLLHMFSEILLRTFHDILLHKLLQMNLICN